MAETSLSVLIKVLKEGNGDKETIAALEKMQTATQATTKKSKGMRIEAGRVTESLMRQAGASNEAMIAMKVLEGGTKSLTEGLTATTLAMGALGLTVAATASLISKYSKEWDDATKGAYESEKQLNEVLEKRRKMMMDAGLSPAASIQDIVNRNMANQGAINTVNALTGQRDRSLEQMSLDFELGGIRRDASSRVNMLQLRRQGVGLTGAAVFRAERSRALAEAGKDEADSAAKLVALHYKRTELASTLQEQEEAMAILRANGAKHIEEQVKGVEKTRKLLAETNRELTIAEAKHKAIAEATKLEKDLRLAEIAEKERVFGVKKAEEQLSISKQFADALEEQFAIEARLKGVEDDRVARAYAYLQVNNQSVEANRLLNLELDRQKQKLNEISTLTGASKAIAKSGGLNIESLVGRGATLGERSRIRNLSTDFQAQYQAEAMRLRRSGIRDEGAIQEQMAKYTEQKLGAMPTLRGMLGIATPEAATSRDKQINEMVRGAELSRQVAGARENVQELAKQEKEFFAAFDGYTREMSKQIDGIKQKLKYK